MARIDEVRDRLRQRPRRWLVTGAAGFIGSHLVEELLELGQDVVALDDFSTGTRANVEDVRRRVGTAAERLRFVEGDICELETCHEVTADVDLVLHQAALGSVPRSIADPLRTHQVNVDGFVNVLLAAREAGVETVVYASSSSVYGDSPALPKREDVIGAPLSPYALSKLTNERYAANYARTFGQRIVGLRYFNVFGPRQRPDGPYAAVIPKWLSLFARGEQPAIFGDGDTSRDFCPVANVVQANLLAATADPPAPDAVHNVALGGNTTLNQLYGVLRTAMAAAGAPCGDLEPTYEDFRPGDVRHSHADVTRAREQLGYAPDVDFAEGIRRTVEHFMSGRGD